MNRNSCIPLMLASALFAVNALGQQPSQFIDRIQGPPGMTWTVSTADLDGDGDVDIVNGSPSWYRNDGTGRFSPEPLFQFNFNASAIGDVDGDTDLDVYIENSAGRTLLLNDGAGAFAEINQGPVNPLRSAWDAAFVDLDLDGDLDIARLGPLQFPEFLENDGTGNFTTFPAAALPAAPFVSFTRITVGDLNGDGREDLIFRGRQHYWLVSSASGYVLGTQPPGFDPASTTVIGDFSGDGIADLLEIGNALYAGDGSGSFVPTSLVIPSAGMLNAVAVDLDDDGDLDVAGTGAGAGGAVLWINDGSGALVDESANRSGSTFTGARVIANADFDGDFDQDLFVGTLEVFSTPDRLLINRHAQITVLGPVSVGGSLALECASRPGYGTGVGFSLCVLGMENQIPVTTPFGSVHVAASGSISLPVVSLPSPIGVGQTNIAVPNDAALTGLRFAVQALNVDLFGTQEPRLTNFDRFEIQ